MSEWKDELRNVTHMTNSNLRQEFDMYYDKNIKRDLIIGGLFNKKHKTKRHSHLLRMASRGNYKLEMLGLDCKNRPFYEINDFYNKLSAWVSTSELEGFHNPPTEAAMAGVPIIVSDARRGGTSDYAIHNETALIYSSGDIDEAIMCISTVMNDKDLAKRLVSNMKKLLRLKIGSREECMKKFIKYIGDF